MNDTFKADTAAMEAAASKMSSIHGDMVTTIGQLKSAASEMAQHWASSAGSAYQEVMAAVDGNANKMQTALETMNNTMKSQSQKYASLSDEHKAKFSNIEIPKMPNL